MKTILTILLVCLLALRVGGMNLLSKNFQLTWTQSDMTGVTGWNVYSNGTQVASITSNSWNLPTSTPFGAVFQVAATNSTTGEESDYSNAWTNTIPASPINVKRK